MRWLPLLLCPLLSCGKADPGADSPFENAPTTEAPDETGDTGSITDTSPPDDTQADTDDTAPPDTSDTGATYTHPDTPPAVILMIGDGMGPGQLQTASLYAHGEPGHLFLQSLDHHAQVRTGSLSGITDSAASATAMATGHKVLNARIGVDRNDDPAQTLVELAQSLGMATAVVSTASVTHATPAAFTAHNTSRNNYIQIADDQALNVRPDILLGGGAKYFLGAAEEGSTRDDDGLITPLTDGGCQVVRTADELATASRAAGACLYGFFADDHLQFVEDLPEDSTEPSLTAMSLAAWEIVSQDPEGFLLVIEGARIDMASHQSNLANAIGETLAFDDAIQTMAAQLDDRDDVTLIVTADHECGGLEVLNPAEAGALPEVSWRWDEHTNANIDLYASGPLTQTLHGRELTHGDVHAVLKARLTRGEIGEVPLVLTPDGDTNDQRWRVATQTQTTDFGEGYNQLEALTLDADAWGLAVGVEGVFEWEQNAVVVLIDADFGEGSGIAALDGALSDDETRADAIVSALPLPDQGIEGFGVDLAFVDWGGTDVWLDELQEHAGLRALTSAYGASPDNLYWHSAAGVFGQGVRTRDAAASPTSGEGLELAVPWDSLYPELGGSVPAGATIAIAVVLVNDDGSLLSNQALPPFVSGAALSGVAVFTVDSDGDGVGDGDAEPTLTP